MKIYLIQPGWQGFWENAGAEISSCVLRKKVELDLEMKIQREF